MKLKPILFATAALVGTAAVAFGGLMTATNDPAPMLATVSDDATLPTLSGDSVTLHGEILGPDNAPLIIVLHGGPGGDYRSLMALSELSDTHRVLFFDQRGAGLSERLAPAELGVDRSLADIDALVDQYAPDTPVIFVGHSFGAMLAVAYAGHAPDRVARAVLIEPGFLDQAGYAEWEARRQDIAKSPEVSFAAVLAGFQARHVTVADAHAERDFVVGSVVHAFADHVDNPYHCPGEAYSAPSWRFGGEVSDLFWADPSPLLDAMGRGLSTQTELLFLAGGCNGWTGEALQNAHAAQFERADMVMIENAGHDVIWDQSTAALTAIRAFLE